jgi:hypothetical protein
VTSNQGRDPDSLLDAIDGALRDYATSLDAMRWTGTQAPATHRYVHWDHCDDCHATFEATNYATRTRQDHLKAVATGLGQALLRVRPAGGAFRAGRPES